MRFARPAEDTDGLADEVRGHLESRAFWIEPAAYCTGLVSEILDVLRHPAVLRRDVARRPGQGLHYVGSGRTPQGHLLHIGFHFERTGSAAADSLAHVGFGSRLLVDSAWCEAEPSGRAAPGAWTPATVGPRPWWAT